MLFHTKLNAHMQLLQIAKMLIDSLPANGTSGATGIIVCVCVWRRNHFSNPYFTSSFLVPLRRRTKTVGLFVRWHCVAVAGAVGLAGAAGEEAVGGMWRPQNMCESVCVCVQHTGRSNIGCDLLWWLGAGRSVFRTHVLRVIVVVVRPSVRPDR